MKFAENWVWLGVGEEGAEGWGFSVYWAGLSVSYKKGDKATRIIVLDS